MWPRRDSDGNGRRSSLHAIGAVIGSEKNTNGQQVKQVKRGEEEMKSNPLHLLLCGVLAVVAPALGASLRQAIGTAVGVGPIRVDGVPMPSGVVFYSGDRISTTSTEASIYLAKSNVLTLGPSSAALVTATPTRVVVQLRRGTIAALDTSARPVIVDASGITIESQRTGGSYEVALTGAQLRVVTRRGVTLVAGANRSVAVPAGNLLRTTVHLGPAGAGAGNLLMVTVIAVGAAAAAGTILGIAAASPGPACVSASQLSCP